MERQKLSDVKYWLFDSRFNSKVVCCHHIQLLSTALKDVGRGRFCKEERDTITTWRNLYCVHCTRFWRHVHQICLDDNWRGRKACTNFAFFFEKVTLLCLAASVLNSKTGDMCILIGAGDDNYHWTDEDKQFLWWWWHNSGKFWFAKLKTTYWTTSEK